MSILVTGGAGFIGSNFVLDRVERGVETVVNLDLLTYAGNRGNLDAIDGHPRHAFVHGDIRDGKLVAELLDRHRPSAIVNFAAESHVDRSIHGPDAFVSTNIVGTFTLLEAARIYWQSLDDEGKAAFRFLQVSTDEVFGALRPGEPPFRETSPYAPNSPYAASKAGADHLVRAYHRTYGLPTLTTHCSNNYGPYQFPEKLIPLMITNALAGKPLPIYGDGRQVRDWLHVKDHCAAILRVLEAGSPGETYAIGGDAEMTNLALVETICGLLNELRPRADGGDYKSQISFTRDRPGHDRRYAIDASRIKSELGWRPAESFASGIVKTIDWYLENPEWMENVTSGAYREWMTRHYGGTA